MNALSPAIAAGDPAALTASLRGALLANHANIPDALKQRKAWLVWRVGAIDPARRKFGKVPVYPMIGRNRCGAQGSAEDRAGLGTWEEAWAALAADPNLAGLGIALLPEFGLVALDADHCVTRQGGAPSIATRITALCGSTYTEISPSGSGVRAFWLGAAQDGKNHGEGIELFHAKGFVTVTGNRVAGGALETLSQDHGARLRALLNTRTMAEHPEKTDLARLTEQAFALPQLPRIREALFHIPADDRDTWIGMGHALKTAGDAAESLWHEWSATSPKYDRADAERTWDSFAPTQTGPGAIFAQARRHGWADGLATPRAPQASGDPIPVDLRTLPLVPPTVPFLIPGWLPAGVVTLFAAHGGAGKSFVSLYIAICLAIGWHPFEQGQRLPRQRVLFYSAEDAAPHLQGRLRRYLNQLGFEAADLDGWLHLLDATSCDNVLFRTDRSGAAPTPRFDWLAQEVRRLGADLLIFDNASDALDANENDRAAVRRFMAALRNLAPTVLLLSHLDAASSMARPGQGKGYSGSTAWHNSARSRWLLTRDGGECLVLQQPKVNYARAGAEVLLRWSDEHQVFTVTGSFGRAPGGEAHRSLLLGLLAEAMAEGADISPHPTANNNLYRALCDRPGFPARLDKAVIRTELAEWQRLGFVRAEGYRRPNRQIGQRLALTEKGRAMLAGGGTIAQAEEALPDPVWQF